MAETLHLLTNPFQRQDNATWIWWTFPYRSFQPLKDNSHQGQYTKAYHPHAIKFVPYLILYLIYLHEWVDFVGCSPATLLVDRTRNNHIFNIQSFESQRNPQRSTKNRLHHQWLQTQQLLKLIYSASAILEYCIVTKDIYFDRPTKSDFYSAFNNIWTHACSGATHFYFF